MSDAETVSLEIALGDHRFRIRIPAQERARYETIARYVAEAFDEVRRQARTHGDRAWAMTAFQLATELFEAQRRLDQGERQAERIRHLIDRIERASPTG